MLQTSASEPRSTSNRTPCLVTDHVLFLSLFCSTIKGGLSFRTPSTAGLKNPITDISFQLLEPVRGAPKKSTGEASSKSCTPGPLRQPRACLCHCLYRHGIGHLCQTNDRFSAQLSQSSLGFITKCSVTSAKRQLRAGFDMLALRKCNTQKLQEQRHAGGKFLLLPSHPPVVC